MYTISIKVNGKAGVIQHGDSEELSNNLEQERIALQGVSCQLIFVNFWKCCGRKMLCQFTNIPPFQINPTSTLPNSGVCMWCRLGRSLYLSVCLSLSLQEDDLNSRLTWLVDISSLLSYIYIQYKYLMISATYILAFLWDFTVLIER